MHRVVNFARAPIAACCTHPHRVATCAAQAHSVGGIFVLDCVASGCLWVDMESVGADVVITAPQKGWSADPCAALVMLSPAARKLADTTKSTSMVIDLSMWLKVMDTYESGGHMYYTTMPTNALVVLRDVRARLSPSSTPAPAPTLRGRLAGGCGGTHTPACCRPLPLPAPVQFTRQSPPPPPTA